MRPSLRQCGFVLTGVLLLSLDVAPCLAQRPAAGPATQPRRVGGNTAALSADTRPAPSPPATLPAETQRPPSPPASLRPLDPKVQQILSRARQAYASLKTYQDLGSVTTTMTIHGRTAETTAPASTTFAQPNRFISTCEAMSLYCDGKTLSIYSPARGRYCQQPLEQPPPPGPAPTAQSIMRNLPVLWTLLKPDQSLLATATAFDSAVRPQEDLAGRTVDHVQLTVPADAWFGPAEASQGQANRVTMDMFFDARTHMLLRLNLDLTSAMVDRIARTDPQGTSPQVTEARWQFNAGQVRLNAPIADDTFVFKSPADAEPVESIAALFAAGSPAPVNPEEEAEQREAQQARLPYPAPDFTLPDLTGRPVKLSDLRGKVVVLDFWATWCPPCRAWLPHVQQLHEELKDRGVVVLGIDIAEESKAVLDFVEKNKMSLPILLDEEDKTSPLYHVTGIPHTVVIDQTGQVVKVVSAP
jgi:peroxiredoxin/outer membrane lipoprotein-sorting protein